MEKLGEDKMMKGTEKAVVAKTAYFFPEHSVTIEADSQEEAEELLTKLLTPKE